ncbi:MAG: hypothetical protein UT43_C0001G0018 [Parcubacteria group bacterium GW2011_GWC1_39_29]|uniref:Uncharacterized protein n=1 Tax=Candidatus Yanofskybacteria bacterium GW2011_GWD1_39_16 TaxID=1619030 RepID=A0A837HQS5_9BACT|nr:MAG: hypothetical protein UT35_C0004G0011 [Candidatus Yanofskybacteria bacterium GW2011_GWD1_39_16]KKR15395.1 MAG: hypothetical protein UT43_C0001G0018 [Parcubacteria group bacterium GW2011_GWC1_39_29]
MSIIQFENGVKVQFEGTPTEKDIEEVFQSMQKQGKLSAIKTVDEEKPAQPQKDLLSKAAGVGEKILGFTGGKNIAEIGGSLLAGQSLPQALKTQGGTIGKGITKTVGDIGQLGVTIGTAVLPVAKSLKVAVGAGTLLGGTGAIGKGLSEGQSLSQAAKGAVIPAALSGTFFGVGYGVGKLAGVITRQSPEALYQSAIKQSKQDLMKEITGKAPELSKQLIERGVRGTDNKIYSQAITGLVESEKQIDKIISGQIGKQTIQTTQIASSLDDLIRRSQNVFGSEGSAAIETVKQNILNKGNAITVADALQLKRDIYKELSKSAFNVDASLSNQSEALRTVAGSLAEEITKTSAEIGAITKSQQMWIRTAKAIEGKAGIARNNIIGLSDVILSTASVATGDVTKLIPAIGRRIFETSRAKTNVAVLLDRIGKIPTDNAGKIAKTAIINLLKQLNYP